MPAPTQADLAKLAETLCERVCKMLGRRGLIAEASHESNEAEQAEAALDACRNVALSHGRFERLDEQGRAQQELLSDKLVVRNKNSPWVAEHKGFSLHAGVSFGALDKKGREKLVRYCVRPAVALERLSVLRDGSIAYKVKWSTRSGRTHRVMRSLEFMARLASIASGWAGFGATTQGCALPSPSRRTRRG